MLPYATSGQLQQLNNRVEALEQGGTGSSDKFTCVGHIVDEEGVLFIDIDGGTSRGIDLMSGILVENLTQNWKGCLRCGLSSEGQVTSLYLYIFNTNVKALYSNKYLIGADGGTANMWSEDLECFVFWMSIPEQHTGITVADGDELKISGNYTDIPFFIEI